MKRTHNWDRETFIAYDNSYIAEQDKRGKIIAAEKRGKVEGRIEGRIEGEAKVKEEVIKRCWQKNMPVEDIAEITELTIEEVKEIIQSFKDEKNS
jgi:predicted transposase/invertase (TIGR01784 family)